MSTPVAIVLVVLAFIPWLALIVAMVAGSVAPRGATTQRAHTHPRHHPSPHTHATAKCTKANSGFRGQDF